MGNEFNISEKDIQEITKLSNFLAEKEGEEIAGQIQRDKIESTDFDATDGSKYYGDLGTVLDAIRDVSKSMKTPLLSLLEAKDNLPVKGFLFEMRTEATVIGSKDDYKLFENKHAYDPGVTLDAKNNKIMIVGVAVKYGVLAKILDPKGNTPQAVVKRRLTQNISGMNIRKEDCLFNGDMTRPNETDGIRTILIRENALNNTADSLEYNGPTASRFLHRDDLENLIDSAIKTNGGDPSNMVLWMSSRPFRTLTKWFNDDIVYTSSGQFNVINGLPNAPTYLSLSGYRFPIQFFNESKIANLDDLVLLLDMNELSLARLFTPFIKDMPIEYPMDEASQVVVDNFGLNFLYTLTSGFISGITASQ